MAAERSLTLQKLTYGGGYRVSFKVLLFIWCHIVSLSGPHQWRKSRQRHITVSQSFALPSVYSARRSLLKSETSAAQSRLAVSENELRREVSLAYDFALRTGRWYTFIQPVKTVS